MPLWGRSAETVTASGGASAAETTNGQPLYTAGGVNVHGAQLNQVMGANSHYGNTSAGSRANVDVLLFCNDSPSAFVNNQCNGLFPVTPLEIANNRTNAVADRPAHAGWNFRRGGTGGIATAVPTAVAGSGFANGETIVLSNGTSNALLTVTTNATGNMVSLTIGASGGTIVGGAGWVNTAMIANAFTRQSHLANVQTTGVGLQYDNSSIVQVTNTNGLAVAFTANLVTNTTGGLTNASFTTAGVGLFPANQTNAGLAFAVVKYDGTVATGNVSTTGFAGKVVNSSGGGFTLTLGGRAGRVHHETLVAMGSLGMSNAATGPNSANFVLGSTVNNPHFPG